MTITLSPEHATARADAARLPALYATLARLEGIPEEGSNPEQVSTLTLYDTADPTDANANVLAEMPLALAAGSVDEDSQTLTLLTPLESQVSGADPLNGSRPLSARITGPTGTWEMDLTVSATDQGGDIQLPETGEEDGTPVARLFNGATASIDQAVIQG